MALYLTPTGAAPSDVGYLAVGYTEVCDILDSMAETSSHAVRVALQQYTQAVRRHIVGNSEEMRLSQEIYRKHKRALDFIYQNRPDHRTEIYEIILSLLDHEAYPDLIFDEPAKPDIRYVHFGLAEWDVPILLTSSWTPSGRILMFTVTNSLESTTLGLFIGAGPPDTRARLSDMARKDSVFNIHKHVYEWIQIYEQTLLAPEDYSEDSMTKLEIKLRERWLEFVGGKLQLIKEAVRKEQWIGLANNHSQSEPRATEGA